MVQDTSEMRRLMEQEALLAQVHDVPALYMYFHGIHLSIAFRDKANTVFDLHDAIWLY